MQLPVRYVGAVHLRQGIQQIVRLVDDKYTSFQVYS